MASPEREKKVPREPSNPLQERKRARGSNDPALANNGKVLISEDYIHPGSFQDPHFNPVFSMGFKFGTPNRKTHPKNSGAPGRKTKHHRIGKNNIPREAHEGPKRNVRNLPFNGGSRRRSTQRRVTRKRRV